MEPAAEVVKIALVQQLPMTVDAAAQFVGELLAEQAGEEAVARWLVFPESSLLHVYRGVSLKGLEPLLELSDRVGLLVTCEERDGKDVYVTSLALDRGHVVARYRKRRATRTGAHAEGTEAVFFEAGAGLQSSFLICFDVENADVRDEVFHGPQRRPQQQLAVFNPTHIRPLESAAAWRTALQTMQSKFAKRCGEEAALLLRCDQPAPAGAGSSQLIGPDGSVACAGAGPCVLNVFVSATVSNRLCRVLKPPKRDRSKLEDNDGSRCNTNFFSLGKERCRSVAQLQGSLWGLFGDGTLAGLAQRDGSVLRQTTSAEPVHDMCHLPQQRAFVWSSGDATVALLDEGTLQQTSVFSCRENRRLLAVGTSGVLCGGGGGDGGSGGASIVDVRSGEAAGRWTAACEVAAVWGDEERVLLGDVDGCVWQFDRRMSGEPLTKVRGGGERVQAVHRETFASGCTLRSVADGNVVASYNVPVTAVEGRFVGLQDGSLVLNGAVRLPLHCCAVTRLAVSRDRCGILSVSGTRGHGLALSEFLFNCEKAHTVDEMFL